MGQTSLTQKNYQKTILSKDSSRIAYGIIGSSIKPSENLTRRSLGASSRSFIKP